MKDLFTSLVYSLLCVGCTLSLTAQSNDSIPKRILFTQAVEGNSPTIDGIPDDACWQQVEWSGGYEQFEPYNLEAPSQDTKLKVLYDARNLYVAFRCFDTEPDKIERRMSRRDGFPGDWVEINIDSYHDLRTAFSFTISASGVKGDEFVSNDGNNWDSNWNPIWYAKTNIDQEGWTAEIRIPLSQLRFGNAEEHVWGIQSTRRYFREGERDTWQPMELNQPGWVSRFGELHGLKGIKPQRQVEIQPYVLAQTSSSEAEEGNPFATGRDNRFTAGLDARVAVTSDLTLDMTINPDFGQVEADPGALNLDGFQIFFSERRPFFIENRNIFNYRLTEAEAGGAFNSDRLFYSRRIGGSPHRFVNGDPDKQMFVDQPDNTTILGAAKFSGKTRKGLSIGILESVTERELATIDLLGERTTEVVEPLTNFFVGRVQQDYRGGNTVVGGIFTAVNRNLENNPDLAFLHESAYSGGLDIIHRWKENQWVFTGKLLWSKVNGSEEAIENTQRRFEHLFQRPDADHLEVDSTATSLLGSGGTFKIANYGGNWIFETGVTWRSPELELNDIGFMVNTDEVNYFFWGARRWTQPNNTFRRFQWNYNHWSRWDFSGRNLYRAVNTNAHAQWANFWSSGGGFTYENLDLSKNALRGGPLLRRPNGTAFNMYVNTDSRKRVQFGLNTFQAFGQSQIVRVQSYGMWLNLQPTNAMSVSLSPSFNRFQRDEQYVTQLDFEGEKRYINAEVDQQTFSLTARLNYNITPDLTVQYYGQPFISRGRYQNFNRTTDNPLGKTFEERFRVFEVISYDEESDQYLVDENDDRAFDYEFGNPDFNFIQFRSNLVLRWEYIPGSELFLVWSQGANAFEDPARGLARSITDNLFGNNVRNTFLVKMTYRFLP
ncbi:MAG: DUF5916 domain-containing protein [Bacteroidota bacterium]